MTGEKRWPLGHRSALASHLHHHPDHARHYPAGHDFVLRATADIVEEHERLHGQARPYAGRLHWHAAGLETEGERMAKTDLTPHQKALEKMLGGKQLELKVTVASTPSGPDVVLAKMDLEKVLLFDGKLNLKVVKVERADGQPFGLETEFEEYWAETHSHREGTDWDAGEKMEARDAFLYGVKFGRENA